jgi:hypothetical protein
MLDPRQRLDKYTNGDVVVTKTPAEYPDHVSEQLLQLRRKGLPLVVEVEPEKPAQPMSMAAPSDEEEPPKPRRKKASTD